MFKRILSLILCFSIVFSLLCSSAFAAGSFGSDLITDTASVNAWNNWLDSNLYVQVSLVADKPQFWDEFDRAIMASGAGSCGRNNELMSARDNWNGSFSTFLNPLGPLWFRLYALVFTGKGIRPIAEVAFDSTLGVYRLREVNTKLWIVNSSGHFPYFRPFSDGGSGGGFPDRIGQWRREEAIKDDQALWHVVIGADLSAYQENWADERSSVISRADGDYYWLVAKIDGVRHVLCDDYGYPYYVPIDKQNAVTTPNNYYTEEGDSYTDESTNIDVKVYDDGSAIVGSIIDVENGIVNVGGETYYIDDLTYDASSKTYYVDSHDEYTYNSTTNNYTTNNYRWEIQYNIDYTSVTYIGQTSEYEERYEYYYELPDGRSSADLTVADLEQLSVVFADVMNYSRTTDNAQMRALYHFDGDTLDDSYWSYTRNGFEWQQGASLTYMDEGVFNGSLYLDETDHQFSITLPSNQDAFADWTLQFRYYQSHTEAPVKDSYLSVGGVPLLYFTGSQYLDKNGKVICATSVGTWNEICLVRSSGRLLYFINGVYYKYVSDDFHWPEISFYFGSSQQTYKKIDELRFTKAALFDSSSYTPSVVPYDTNLALVLPDAAQVVADEYFTYKPPTRYVNLCYQKQVNWGIWDWHWGEAGVGGTFLPFVTNDVIHLFAEGDYSDYSTTADGNFLFTPLIDAPTVSMSVEETDDSVALGGAIFLPVLAGDSKDPLKCDDYCYVDTGYIHQNLAVILSDGSYSYISFKRSTMEIYSNASLVCSPVINSRVVIEPGYLGGAVSGYSNKYVHGFFIYSIDGEPLEILDIVVTGDVVVRWSVTSETVLYDADELTEDPILAVRSNLPITNYQIGGVRPSYPEKGQVYAMVENNRITSLQQYTGFLWEAVDGRIWTGLRWIPYSSFDVKTMQDFFDIEGVSEDDYFYSESGFWSWFQRQWKVLLDKIDQVIFYLKEVVGIPEKSDCEHVYRAEDTEPTCSMPGGKVYTCKNCGDIVLESVPALGHDWVITEDVPSEFNLPEDAHCPSCDATDFTYELNAEQDAFSCVCSACDREWKETPVVTWGHTISECSRCGITQTESKEPGTDGFFSVIGNFISDGIVWTLDKLTQLVEAVSGIQDTFKSFADRIKENVGQYPAFLAAAIAVFPGDLMDVIWFAVVALIAVAVYKKITR